MYEICVNICSNFSNNNKERDKCIEQCYEEFCKRYPYECAIEKLRYHLKEIMRLIHDPSIKANDDMKNLTIFSCAIVSYVLDNEFDKALELVDDIKKILERLRKNE